MSREVICRRLSLQCGVSYEELCRLSVEVKLPWCGVVLSGSCKGLCWNEGLYTQCVRECVSEYCVECSVKRKGGCWLGSVYERKNSVIGEYVVGGRVEVSYLKVMKKHGITREMAERSARAEGVIIPEKHFEERIEEKRGRGRPRQKKEVVEVCEVVEKRGRGRPRKEKSVKSNSEGEELIALLIKAEEVEVEVEGEEEEIEVNKIELEGKMYLISKLDNILYDFVSHEEIGKWNENEKKIE